jgi:lysyl-tRNA synthetase class 2
MICESSLLQAAAYDVQSSVLAVTFHSGAIYRYLDVPASTYEEFVHAESKGRYFNSTIRNRFKFVKLLAAESLRRDD